MNRTVVQRSVAIGGGVVLVVAGALALHAHAVDDKEAKKPAAAKAALTVVVTRPQRATLPLTVRANGNIAAWISLYRALGGGWSEALDTRTAANGPQLGAAQR